MALLVGVGTLVVVLEPCSEGARVFLGLEILGLLDLVWARDFLGLVVLGLLDVVRPRALIFSTSSFNSWASSGLRSVGRIPKGSVSVRENLAKNSFTRVQVTFR